MNQKYFKIKNNNKIRIYKNGDSNKTVDISLPKNPRFSNIRKSLESSIFQSKSISKMRLFTNEGVEIHEDDLPFLKNGAALYASNGFFLII